MVLSKAELQSCTYQNKKWVIEQYSSRQRPQYLVRIFVKISYPNNIMHSNFFLCMYVYICKYTHTYVHTSRGSKSLYSVAESIQKHIFCVSPYQIQAKLKFHQYFLYYLNFSLGVDLKYCVLHCVLRHLCAECGCVQ